MGLAVVKALRPGPLLTDPDAIAAFEQDLLSEYVLARASAGVGDRTIVGEADAIVELREWFRRPLWEMQPTDLDRFFGVDQKAMAGGTKVRKANAISIYFTFLELRHRPDIHATTGHLVANPVDEMNRPRAGREMGVRIPPPAEDLERFFAAWRDELAGVRKWEPAVRNYTSARLMSLIGQRVSESCLATIGDVRFDLGRFGKIRLQGKGRNGQKKERLAPLINGADELLRWWLEGPRWEFDDNVDDPSAPLFPSERKLRSGVNASVCDSTLRDGLKDTAVRLWPAWAERMSPHVLRHFAASDLFATGMNVVAIQELLGHRWLNTTMIYVHVNKTHIEDSWVSGAPRAALRFTG